MLSEDLWNSRESEEKTILGKEKCQLIEYLPLHFHYELDLLDLVASLINGEKCLIVSPYNGEFLLRIMLRIEGVMFTIFDLSSEMRSYVRKGLRRFGLKEESVNFMTDTSSKAFKIPTRSEIFDCIIYFHRLKLSSDLVCEMRRVLKRDGLFLVGGYNNLSLLTPIYAYFSLMKEGEHFKLLNSFNTLSILRTHGFEIMRSYGFLHPKVIASYTLSRVFNRLGVPHKVTHYLDHAVRNMYTSSISSFFAGVILFVARKVR